MKLSKYHQNYIDQPVDPVQRKADEKEQKLIKIFSKVCLNTDSDPN